VQRLVGRHLAAIPQVTGVRLQLGFRAGDKDLVSGLPLGPLLRFHNPAQAGLKGVNAKGILKVLAPEPGG
jgi:hypothetical protein